jgi:hypothetical protein
MGVSMAIPTVCLVTPAQPSDKVHKSLEAFEDELHKNLGWKWLIDFEVYWGSYNLAHLTTAATTAVADANDVVNAGQRAAIVTAGVVATNIVLGLEPAIPIIQAVGGAAPTVPSGQTNATGFYINALATAQAQMGKLVTDPVVVLYDNTPDTAAVKNPSNYIWGQLVGARPTLRPLTAQKPADLKSLDPTKLTGANGFMLLPNAMFYNHCDDIAKYVDGKTATNGAALPIYYPEREYKKAHSNINGVKVLGHNVPLTYRMAARYVDRILDGTLTVGAAAWPSFGEALPDND